MGTSMMRRVPYASAS